MQLKKEVNIYFSCIKAHKNIQNVRNYNHFNIKKTKKELVCNIIIQINSCVRKHKKNQKRTKAFCINTLTKISAQRKKLRG